MADRQVSVSYGADVCPGGPPDGVLPLTRALVTAGGLCRPPLRVRDRVERRRALFSVYRQGDGALALPDMPRAQQSLTPLVRAAANGANGASAAPIPLLVNRLMI